MNLFPDVDDTLSDTGVKGGNEYDVVQGQQAGRMRGCHAHSPPGLWACLYDGHTNNPASLISITAIDSRTLKI